MRSEIRDLLLSVRSPFRYVGGEVGSRPQEWERAQVRICLAFPDAYELGMSHLGLSILYHILNDEPTMLAERAFAPWADMEAELSRRRVPLFSLESHRPLSDFDIVGLSLGYELTYTNMLAMLSLAGIPLRAEARCGQQSQSSQSGQQGVPVTSHESRWPLVIAGGPCAFNPLPVAPFFDAIVIGDGERAILDIARAVAQGKRAGTPRGALLEELAEMRGVFVPAVRGEKLEGGTMVRSYDSTLVRSVSPTYQRTNVPAYVGRATATDLDAAPFPHAPVVPHAATQERLAVEVARGCGRGCRFCQAGFIYRPVRQRSGGRAVDLAHRALSSCGAEEFSFLSLSVGDWAPLEGALAGVHARCGTMPVNATLPSLRTEALTQGVMNTLGGARAGSFTLAPEAGTERMRRFINKGNTDADLYASVEKVFAGGWHAVKLYFMVGFPGEAQADIDGICEIANRCLDIGRRYHPRPDVTVSTSTFVPKAHTPFEWERQISIAETLEIQRTLKRRLRRPGLAYRWHNAEMSFLEGVFSRGGEELAAAIEVAAQGGARFDGWDECFDLSRWREAFSRSGIDPEAYLRERGCDEVFPWDGLGVGPDRDFLWRERERAYEFAVTPDCTVAECSRCGMCDFREVRNRIAGCETSQSSLSSLTGLTGLTSLTGLSRIFRYRLRYTKEGRAAFLGSIEALDALRRGLRASGLPLVYSEGFHPRPRVAAGPALPLGIESRSEFLDVELLSEIAGEEIVRRLTEHLPEGMVVLGVEPIPRDAASIEEGWRLIRYEVDFTGHPVDLKHVQSTFADAPSVRMRRVRGEKTLEIELKECIAELAVLSPGMLGVAVRNTRPSLRIGEILVALAGLGEEAMRRVPVRKVAVEWNEARSTKHEA